MNTLILRSTILRRKNILTKNRLTGATFYTPCQLLCYGVSILLLFSILWAGHYIFALLFLSFFFFLSLPNLSGHRLDIYHTSTHGVALVRI